MHPTNYMQLCAAVVAQAVEDLQDRRKSVKAGAVDFMQGPTLQTWIDASGAAISADVCRRALRGRRLL